MLRWLGRALVAKRLRVELRPESVRLARQSVFARARVLSVPKPGVAPASDAQEASELWRAAVDVLADALRGPSDRPRQVEIVLSNHFVRYLLVPWSEGLVADRERLGFAQLAMRDVYGPVADTWDICLDEQPAGRASFVCAVDRALVSALRDVVARAGARLVALTPALADCINRHRAALKFPEFCLVSAEPGRVSVAFHSRQGWQAVRSRRIEGWSPETLPTLLKQETAMSAATEGGVLYVCTQELPEIEAFAVPGWQVVYLGRGASAGKLSIEPKLAPAGGGSGA